MPATSAQPKGSDVSSSNSNKEDVKGNNDSNNHNNTSRNDGSNKNKSNSDSSASKVATAAAASTDSSKSSGPKKALNSDQPPPPPTPPPPTISKTNKKAKIISADNNGLAGVWDENTCPLEYSYASCLEAFSRPLSNSENPVVFMDVSVGTHPLGRIRIELFKHIMPKGAENFRQFCTGEYRENGVPIGYKGVEFHRVIKGFMIQGGDFVRGDGVGSMSIYGSSYPLETPQAMEREGDPKKAKVVPHFRGGLVCMANNRSSGNMNNNDISSSSSSSSSTEAANGCQFFFTCGKCDWLDGANDVVGQLLGRESLQVMRKLEYVSTDLSGKPRVTIRITECGEL